MSVGAENETASDDLSLRSLDRPGLGFRLFTDGGGERRESLFEGRDGSPGVDGKVRGCGVESESGEGGTKFVAEENE